MSIVLQSEVFNSCLINLLASCTQKGKKTIICALRALKKHPKIFTRFARKKNFSEKISKKMLKIWVVLPQLWGGGLTIRLVNHPHKIRVVYSKI